MKMKGDRLRCASISDIHLGNANTPTVDILARLRDAFPDSDETGELDVIWLAGDIFDKLLHLPDPNVTEIQLWIAQFLRVCKKRDIVVRVLEGTPSHDRGQPVEFDTINRTSRIGVDLKYVATLSIEYIERLDIHVLYIPDEWDHDPNDTWESVKALLQQHGLRQVDFICMHGQFEYHLPEHLKLPYHQSERYLSITKYYIFIGHIHFTSVRQRILTAGSFDRLTHNEEGPKGHFRLAVSVDGRNDEIEFRENVNATKYVTIDCTDIPLSEAMDKIDEYKTLPQGSHLRIRCTTTSEIRQALPALREKYPDFHWKSKILNEETEGQQSASTGLGEKFEAVEITNNNIGKLLQDKLVSMGCSDERIAHVQSLLSRVM